MGTRYELFHLPVRKDIGGQSHGMSYNSMQIALESLKKK